VQPQFIAVDSGSGGSSIHEHRGAWQRQMGRRAGFRLEHPMCHGDLFAAAFRITGVPADSKVSELAHAPYNWLVIWGALVPFASNSAHIHMA
jgi:hypothetical protein